MIRKATAADIGPIAEIYERIHDEEEAGRASVGWLRSIYPTRETAKAGVLRGDMYVYESGGVISAAAVINQMQVKEYSDCDWRCDAPENEVMVLHTLVVDPGVKGSGIGKTFVKFYEEYALSQNCSCLRMDTQEKNTAARAFYKKLGFHEAGAVDCAFNGISGVRLICLEKKLR